MAYKNFTNCTEEQYYEIIYSQDDKNRIRIWFNNVELEDAGQYCESLKAKDRIILEDGSKRFSIGNFISKELTLVLRDLPQNTIVQDQVKISIGTLVGENTYEDVPLGVFNIQNEPKTDKNKITITLRDNRVKFDFYYNAKPLIEANNGKANYYQILNDICNQAGVANNVGHFEYDDTQISIYDNTIKAATYVGYLAEQCGKIPQIDRNGTLIFVDLLSDKETQSKGKNFTISSISKTKVDNIELIGETTQSGTPTPSSPQEVVNVTGRQEIKAVGKNLYYIPPQTLNGVTLSYDNDGAIVLNGTSTASFTAFRSTTSLNGNYTLSAKASSAQSSTYIRTRNASSTIGHNIQLTSTNQLTATANVQISTLEMTIGASGITYNNFKIYVQLESGSSATTYEPYIEQVNEINLGKNLLNNTMTSQTLNSVTFTVNNDKSITIQGTATARTEPRLWNKSGSDTLVLVKNKTYYNNTNRVVYMYAGGYITLNAGGSYTPTENKDVSYIYIRVENAETIDTTIYPMISTTQNTSYAPYFTPIELCKIGNYKDKIFKTTGKNLSTLDHYTNNVSGVYYVDKKLLNNFENNTTYTLSFDITSTVTPFRVSVGYGNNSFEADMTGGTLNNQNNGHITLTFTTNNTTYNNLWLRAPRYTSATTYQTSVSNIMLVKGTQEAEYEPYGSGEWYVKKNIGKVVLNGSESWQNWSTTDTNYSHYQLDNAFVYNNTSGADIRGVCNFYPVKVNGNPTEISLGLRQVGDSVYRIYLTTLSTLSTLSDFKTWLSTHNTIVYYVLSTPTYEKLNDTLQDELNNIYLVEGLNNIVSTIPITFEYYKPKQPIRIPLSIVEKYELGTPYKVERVVYESGTIKFETSNNKTLDTLYLDAANMYINSQRQIDNIFDTFRTLNIDSVTTGKILGNPAIDSYDIIEVYDDEDENETIIFKTFANLEYTFNGVHRHKFDTQIGKEERVENVSINSGATFQKIAKSEIDSLNGTITNVVSETNTVSAIVIGTYGLTEDTNFQADKNYYILNENNEYVLYEDYTVGDTIPANTIYDLTGSKIQELDKNYSILDQKIDNTNDNTIKELQKYTDSKISQSREAIELSFDTKYDDYTNLNTATNDRIDAIHQYLRYLQEDNSVRLGISTENIELVLKNNKIYFYDKTSSEEVAYISENKLYITNAQILTSIQIGNFTFIPRSNGSLGFRKVS